MPTHQPAKDVEDIGLDAIEHKAADDEIDLSGEDVRAALQAVMPGLLRTEIEQATKVALDRARGRVN